MSLPIKERQITMFREKFHQFLDPKHELMRAGRMIPWDTIHDELSCYYSKRGRRPKFIRLMVGLHILKHRYNVSDEQATQYLHENVYWQAFCGFDEPQPSGILDSSSMTKFRQRIGPKGMARIEQIMLECWTKMGLVKTKRMAVDTTAQPKHIAYPTDADLLHKIGRKLVGKVKAIRKEVAFRKFFRSFSRTSRKVYLQAKKLYRRKPELQQEAISALSGMVEKVCRQASGMANSLYARGRKELGRELNALVRLGRKVVAQTRAGAQGLRGEKFPGRIYSLHEPKVAPIKKGKSQPDCEFGAKVAMGINEDGLVLSHAEYQENVADVHTMGRSIARARSNTGRPIQDVSGDRGFHQAEDRMERCRRRWGVKRLAVACKGPRGHPCRKESWFRRNQRIRNRAEPVIGHLKSDHRMNRCRYRGPLGDTCNVVWATMAWNMKKVVGLEKERENKRRKRELIKAA
jgi:IS5 family transposase